MISLADSHLSENIIKLSEAVNNRLEKKAQVIERLEPIVTHLEAQVDKLRHNLDEIHEDLVTHGEILERLMKGDDDEDDDNEEEDFDDSSDAWIFHITIGGLFELTFSDFSIKGSCVIYPKKSLLFLSLDFILY